MPMMRTLAPLLSIALLLSACDKPDDKKTDKQAEKKPDDKKPDDKKVEEPKPEEPKPEAAVVLTLGAAKIMEKDKPEEVIEIAADGTVKIGSDPEHTVKISTDGKVSKVDGTLIAQVGPDGSVSFDGKPSGVVLDDTGLSMTAPDGKKLTLRFGEDGSIAVDPPTEDALAMTAEGCAGPMAKTCGLVMTMLLFSSEPAPSDPTSVEVGPAVEAVEAKPQ
jgi:hypothetical protein